ncbi:MAG: leucyl aminopeptidase family protein, partial [Hyphomicrobiaceae bacterium]|nr:leucyl aminopeptidase family protein [Hyphomicrobiaceae bacterium]
EPAQQAWLAEMGFEGKAKQQTVLPGADGRIAGVVFGMGDGAAGVPSGPSDLLLGHLAQTLPPGAYRLEQTPQNPELAALAWGLGSYRYRRYKGANCEPPPKLRIPGGVNGAALVNALDAVWQGRDLINTPASDLGPGELEAAARDLANRYGADVTVITGDDLLTQNFPMIHAVGRASPRAPRLIDVTWGRADAPAITLVGKGICFDTGGLDIKPAAGMLLMKKDMGGAAAALTLAHMIMGAKLDVRLRLLIAAAENSVAGNAFRPGDVLTSRAGTTVEIGNTDAEGRLVLADALTFADEEEPQSVFVFATLTGAARVALGPDLPAFFTDDDAFAADLVAASAQVGDPLWRLPLWPGYESKLDSQVADMNNIWNSPFAGSIVAALFLKRFINKARRFAHFDLYGWRPSATALGPQGGEPQTARGLFAVLQKECTH